MSRRRSGDGDFDTSRLVPHRDYSISGAISTRRHSFLMVGLLNQRRYFDTPTFVPHGRPLNQRGYFDTPTFVPHGRPLNQRGSLVTSLLVDRGDYSISGAISTHRGSSLTAGHSISEAISTHRGSSLAVITQSAALFQHAENPSGHHRYSFLAADLRTARSSGLASRSAGVIAVIAQSPHPSSNGIS